MFKKLIIHLTYNAARRTQSRANRSRRSPSCLRRMNSNCVDHIATFVNWLWKISHGSEIYEQTTYTRTMFRRQRCAVEIGPFDGRLWRFHVALSEHLLMISVVGVIFVLNLNKSISFIKTVSAHFTTHHHNDLRNVTFVQTIIIGCTTRRRRRQLWRDATNADGIVRGSRSRMIYFSTELGELAAQNFNYLVKTL